jgi:hypothetical protein
MLAGTLERTTADRGKAIHQSLAMIVVALPLRARSDAIA